MICSAWGPPSFPFSLTCVRERSADWRYVSVWHLVEGALVPCEARRLPALHCGVFHPGTVFRVRTREQNPALIQSSFRRPFIQTASSH